MFDGYERPNSNMLEKAALRRGREAGIEGTLTIHRIRRTVASHLNVVYDRAAVSHILGHTEEVDARHYDYDVTRVKDVQKSLDKMYN